MKNVINVDSNSKSEDTLSKSNDNLYSTTDQLSNDYKVPPQDTVSIEDIMHATPKGREAVMKAIENSIEVQNKMTKKAQNTLKESNNLNTSEEHIKDTSLDVDWNDLIGQDMSAYEAKENIKILKKTIAAWHKQQQIKLIERIEGEVIGSKENYNFDNMERASVIYRNKLRAKQRQALKKIKERYE